MTFFFALATLLSCNTPATKSQINEQPKVEQAKGEQPKTASIDNVDILKGIKKVTLENGLTVIVKEVHTLPIASVMIWYKVGSANESEGVTGVSHFLEHMMFKGTDKYDKAYVDMLSFKSGGFNNAFTSEDYTAYFFNFASDKWQDALEVEANRMRHLAFVPKEFEAEKQVVIEELRRDYDDPWFALQVEMNKKIFISHPYSHPVLGWKEDLDKMTRDQMIEYYGNFYSPDNAILVIVGDVDTQSVITKVDDLFGRIEQNDTIPDVKLGKPQQSQETCFAMDTAYNVDRLAISYRVEKIGSKSDYVLDVLNNILTEGKVSRLYKRLVEQDKTATYVSSFNGSQKYGGAFNINIEVAPDATLEKVESAIYGEIEKIRKSGVESRELERAKNRILAQWIFDKQSTLSIASAVGRYACQADLNYLATYLANVNAVTKNDITEVINKFFGQGNRVVGYARKAKQEAKQRQKGDDNAGKKNPQYRSIKDRYDFGATPKFTNFLGSPKIPTVDLGEIGDWHLKNGLNVEVAQRLDLPIISIKAYVEAGGVYEPEEKAGLANIVGQMLQEGVEDPITGVKMTSEEIADAIEFVGGNLSTSANGIEISVLSKDKELALNLLKYLLRYPSFPADRLKQVKDLTLAQIQGESDEPRLIASKLFNENVYAGYPLHKPAIGYENTVKSITREDVVDYYKKFFRPDNAVIAVVGDVNLAKLVNTDIKSRFITWGDGGNFSLPQIPLPKKQTTPQIVAKPFNSQQINVYIGHLGVERNNPDYYALKVMDHILGLGPGFTDRLSKTLRNEEGLAYEISGAITIGADAHPSAFTCYIGTAPEKKEKAVGGIFRELNKFLNEGVSDEEVGLSKDYLIRSYVFGFETASGVANYLVLTKRFNLGTDFAKKFPLLISAVTKDDVIKVARKYLDTQNYTMVIVGPVDEKGNVIKKEEPKKEETKEEKKEEKKEDKKEETKKEEKKEEQSNEQPKEGGQK